MSDIVYDSRLPLTSGSFLICLSRPWRHIRHYLGWAPRIADRIAELKPPRIDGPREIAAIMGANEEGIEWAVVRVWRGATKREKERMAAMKESARLCPRCREVRNREHDGNRNWKRKRLKEAK